MAEATMKAGKEAAPAAAKASKLPLIAAVLGSLVLGAGGAAFFLRGQQAPPGEAAAEHGAAPEPAAKGEAGKEGAAPAGATFALEPFLVNLVAEQGTRYLKVKIELELDPPSASSEVEARLPQVRDAVIGLLSSRSFEDVTGFEGKALLKQDVSERINALLAKGRVESVLFTEFVVQ